MTHIEPKTNRQYPTTMRYNLTQQDIDSGTPCKGTLCPIKICVARGNGVPHGYVFVDASGISVTRRPDYREKAFPPRSVLDFLINFDNPLKRHLCKPFRFTLRYHLTTPIAKSSKERKERINVLRRGKPRPHTARSRIIGVAA